MQIKSSNSVIVTFFVLLSMLIVACAGAMREQTPATVLNSVLKDFKLYFLSYRDGVRELYVMEPDGSRQTRITERMGSVDYAVASPNEKGAVFVTDVVGNREIYRIEADGSHIIRLTTNHKEDYAPRWSPDGKRVVFISERDGNAEVYVMNADGSRQTR